MTESQVAKLRARVKKIVDKDGLVKTAKAMQINPGTLRRFVSGCVYRAGTPLLVEAGLKGLSA